MVSWSIYKRLKPHDLGPTWAFGFYASLKKDIILKPILICFSAVYQQRRQGFASSLLLFLHISEVCREER